MYRERLSAVGKSKQGGDYYHMKKRIVSIDLLRIVSMMMVVMLHFLGKGNLLPDVAGSMTVNGYVAWGLESLAIVAVNVYMLISGYFLVETGFKSGRVVELICQVLFYTILVPVVLAALGIIGTDKFTIYYLLQTALPVQMQQYWFITAYIIMYLLSPVLAVAAKTLKREQLRNTVIALLLFFAVSKSILPFQLEVDAKGYDALWFITVFLVAAYIRLYGIPFFAKRGNSRRGMACYLLGCVGVYGVMLAVRFVYFKTGSLDHFIESTYDYNHILNLFAAVSLFYAFYHVKIKEDGFIGKMIVKIAPYTLGVYLLHEQMDMRNLWPGWLGATLECNVFVFVGRSVLAVLIVFAAGILVDMARSFLFKTVRRLCRK